MQDGVVESADQLERRIAQLKRELEDPAELVVADQRWQAAQAEAQAAAGTPEEAETYDRFRELLDERNRIALPRILKQGPSLMAAREELTHAEVQLAQLRSEPFFRAVTVDPSVFMEDVPSEKALLEPDASGSEEFFLNTAFRPPALALAATIVRPDGHERSDIGFVLVRFDRASPMPLWGVSLARFGYPNEEAFEGHPGLGVGFEGIGFYEVVNSMWAEEIVTFNRRRFPTTPDDLGLKHFVVACKENTLQCLATGFSVQSLQGSGDAYAAAVTAYLATP
jgi:hypothetical protein